MKILLIFTGKTTDKYLLEGIEEYINRISRYVSISVDIVKSASAKDIKKAMEEEKKNLLAKILPGDLLVILDEKGTEFSSRQFAGKIQKWMSDGKSRIVFVIGGAFGVDPLLKSKASALLSLSRLTFTHQMVRLILAEQLYRALTILKNEKYHHD